MNLTTEQHEEAVARAIAIRTDLPDNSMEALIALIGAVPAHQLASVHSDEWTLALYEACYQKAVQDVQNRAQNAPEGVDPSPDMVQSASPVLDPV